MYRKLIVLIVMTCTALLIITGCGKREYIYPDGLLALQDETPEIFIEGSEKVSKYFPENEYGKAYINSDGKLCFQLTERQRNSWFSRSKQNLEALKLSKEEEGRVFEYSDNYRELTMTYPPGQTGEVAEQSIRFCASGVLVTQFFSSESEQPLELKLVILDESGDTMETRIYNNETGELERENVEND